MDNDDGDRYGILPYASLVGLADAKLALELAYIEPRIGGVLLSGERGTAKSTAVRAFALMTSGRLPVTLPINATEDRVVGGWKIEDLMEGFASHRPGLLVEADKGLLYVDEVNLLDDHIVNIILDVSSTGVLVVQREGLALPPHPVRFTLVGTMNPEEGTLRPQLLDRFGLAVDVVGLAPHADRKRALENVLQLDAALAGGPAAQAAVAAARAEDDAHRQTLDMARQRVRDMSVDPVLELCVGIAHAFKVKGQRAEQVLALASGAGPRRATGCRRRQGRGRGCEGGRSVGPVASPRRDADHVVGRRRQKARRCLRMKWRPTSTA